MTDEELNKIIGEKCEDSTTNQYILNCLKYFRSRNSTFYNFLCNRIFDLMSKYPNFKFKSDDSSYFSFSKRTIAISKKNIEIGDYTAFIHEITHAIHGLQYFYNIPSEYEYIRNKTTSNDNFMKLVCDLMRYIIQSKKQLLNKCMKKQDKL